jgi:hypothetical protein
VNIGLKVTHGRETNSLVITLWDAPVRESDEVRPGVIADFGEDAERVQFATTGRQRQMRDASRPEVGSRA